jgi:hypothetical protein
MLTTRSAQQMRTQLALCIGLSVTCAAPIARGDEPARRAFHTGAGQEVRVGRHERHGGNCQPAPMTVAVVQPPRHGRIESRPESFVAGGTRVGATSCSGLKIQGLALYYLPEEGFRGTDTFTYEARGSGGPLTFEDSVSVE